LKIQLFNEEKVIENKDYISTHFNNHHFRIGLSKIESPFLLNLENRAKKDNSSGELNHKLNPKEAFFLKLRIKQKVRFEKGGKICGDLF